MTPEILREVQRWHVNGSDFTECARLLESKFGIKRHRSSIQRMLTKAKPKRGSKLLPGPKPPPRKGAMEARDEPREFDNSRILLISDLHCPYQHPDAVAFLTALKAKYKPTRVICLGDEVDHHAMSFHDSDPDLLSAGDELKAAIAQLSPLYKIFPVMDLLDSNHGSLAYRKSKAHGISRKYLRDYGDVLQAPATWRWHNDLLVELPGGQHCYFHHGISKDAMKVVMLRGVCAVQGHFHTEFRIGYIGNPLALLWGMNTGCLIDSKSLAFAYDNLNLGRPVVGTGGIIDGQPRLFPMILNKGGRWNGVVP